MKRNVFHDNERLNLSNIIIVLSNKKLSAVITEVCLGDFDTPEKKVLEKHVEIPGTGLTWETNRTNIEHLYKFTYLDNKCKQKRRRQSSAPPVYVGTLNLIASIPGPYILTLIGTIIGI